MGLRPAVAVRTSTLFLARLLRGTMARMNVRPLTPKQKRFAEELLRQLLQLDRDGWPSGKRDGFTGTPLTMTAAEVAVIKERWARIDEWAVEQGWHAPLYQV